MSMPRHKNQVNFDPDDKTKSSSNLTQKPRQFPSLHWNQVNFDQAHKNQVNFDAHTKTKSFPARTQKSSQFRPPTQKSSQFRSLLWNQVNFDLPHWNQVKFDYPHNNQVIFDAPTTAKSFSDRTQNQIIFVHPHKNQVNRPPYSKHVIFALHTKTKSISTPARRPSQFRSQY